MNSANRGPRRAPSSKGVTQRMDLKQQHTDTVSLARSSSSNYSRTMPSSFSTSTSASQSYSTSNSYTVNNTSGDSRDSPGLRAPSPRKKPPTNHYNNHVAAPRPMGSSNNINVVIRQVVPPENFGAGSRYSGSSHVNRTARADPAPSQTLQVSDYNPAVVSPATTHQSLEKSPVKKKRKFRVGLRRLVQKLKIRIKSFRVLRKTKKSLLNDKSLMEKYRQKKQARKLNKLARSSSHSTISFSKPAVVVSKLSRDSLAVFPPKFAKQNRDVSNSSMLTASNLQKHSLQPFEPLKKNLIEDYISKATEEIEARPSLDDGIVGVSPAAGSPVAATATSVVVSSASSAISTASPASSASSASVSRSSSSASSQIVDPSYEHFVNNWSAYLKNSIASRVCLKLEIARNLDSSIGNYTTTEDNATSANNTPVKRMSVLEAILGDYEDSEDDRQTITEETSGAEASYDVLSSTSSNTIFDSASGSVTSYKDAAERPETAGTIIPDNASCSSGSTVDSLKTSDASESKTQFYSIIDGSEAAKIDRADTVVIKREYHEDESAKFLENTRSILDILEVPEASISDIDSSENLDFFADQNFNLMRQHHHRITSSNKASSEISRSTSTTSSVVAPLNISSTGRNPIPKKFSSMNDLNRFKMENNLKSLAAMATSGTLADRPLSMRYNRKTNNAAIIRFLSQQHRLKEQTAN